MKRDDVILVRGGGDLATGTDPSAVVGGIESARARGRASCRHPPPGLG